MNNSDKTWDQLAKENDACVLCCLIWNWLEHLEVKIQFVIFSQILSYSKSTLLVIEENRQRLGLKGLSSTVTMTATAVQFQSLASIDSLFLVRIDSFVIFTSAQPGHPIFDVMFFWSTHPR